VASQHGGKTTLAQSGPVTERFQGATVWDGVVHVFDLANNPKATRAFAWSSPIEGSDKRRFFAVLHFLPVDSPVAAACADILSEHKNKRPRQLRFASIGKHCSSAG
jgi:hypothetical protein